MSTPKTNDLIARCLQLVEASAGRELSAEALREVDGLIRDCTRVGETRDVVQELVTFAFFLEKKRGIVAPARQLLELVRKFSALFVHAVRSSSHQEAQGSAAKFFGNTMKFEPRQATRGGAVASLLAARKNLVTPST